MLSFQDSMNNCLNRAAKSGVTYNNRVLLVKNLINELIASASIHSKGRIETPEISIEYQLLRSTILIDIHGNINNQTLKLVLINSDKYLLNGHTYDTNSIIRKVIQLLISNNQPKKLYC